MSRTHFFLLYPLGIGVLLSVEVIYVCELLSEMEPLWLLNASRSVIHHCKHLKSDNLTIEEPSFSNQLGGNIKLHSCWKTL